MKKVVIIGGGFGGLNAAKVLGNQPDISITLIDRKNHHLFQPLLYQVATAVLNPADISMPVRSILSSYSNIEVFLGNVIEVDVPNKIVKTDFRNFPYDYLVLACGSNHSYFGHNEWEEFAPGLKTLEQAIEIRSRVLRVFECAEREGNSEKRRQLQTFIIVGGGPTGVELAGAVAELSQNTLVGEFRNTNTKDSKIFLIEAGPRILNGFPEKLSQGAEEQLKKLGVRVLTNTKVTQLTEEGVYLDKEFIPSRTILWAAGVGASELNKKLGLILDERGRVVVNSDLSVPHHPEVFVVGDQASFMESSSTNSEKKQALPGLAPVAIQQGKAAAKNILRDLQGKPRKNFCYNDKGMMAVIGRGRAVATMDRWHFSGFFAWFLWCFIHILYLIGFRNKIFVFFQWVWSYFRFKRGARLITESHWRKE